MQGARQDEVACNEHSIKEECTLHWLEEELNNPENSVKLLNTNLEEQNERKVKDLNEMQELQDRISKEGANTGVQRLFLLKSLKFIIDLESWKKMGQPMVFDPMWIC